MASSNKLVEICGGDATRVHSDKVTVGRPSYLYYNDSQAKYAEIVHHRLGVCKMFYEIYGHGSKCVLFLMGLAGTHAQFQPQFEEFGIKCGDEYSVLVLDNRGVGFSDTPFGPNKFRWTTCDMAADVLQVLHHVQQEDKKWESNIGLVGFSMGGMIALELMLLAPKKFSSLSLIGSHAGGILSTVPPPRGLLTFMGIFGSLGGPNGIEMGLKVLYPDEHLQTPLEKSEHDFSELYEHYPNSDIVETMADHYGLMMVTRGRKYIESGRIKNREMGLDGLCLQISAVMSHYVSWKRLARIREMGIPVAVFCGELDNLVSAFSSLNVLAPALNATMHYYKDGGHGINEQYQKQVNEGLREVMEKGFSLDRTLSKDELAKRTPAPPEFWHPWKVILTFLIVSQVLKNSLQRTLESMGFGRIAQKYRLSSLLLLATILRLKFGAFSF